MWSSRQDISILQIGNEGPFTLVWLENVTLRSEATKSLKFYVADYLQDGIHESHFRPFAEFILSPVEGLRVTMVRPWRARQ